MKKVLIACEESQQVCMAFRKMGFEAYSCDLQECSGGHPEWHLKMDVFKAINLSKWDLIIAHPPCCFLSVAASNLWKNPDRRVKMNEAMEFVKNIYKSDCCFIAIENPVGWLNTNWKKPSQIIEPFYFGDPFRKRTCLWLKNLPLLKKTNVVKPLYYHVSSGTNYKTGARCSTQKEKRSKKDRSKTFPGIASAMAEQWGDFLLRQKSVTTARQLEINF